MQTRDGKEEKGDCDPAPVSTGRFSNGDPFYKLADITYGTTENSTGMVKFSKLPQGVVLVITPNSCSTSSETYEGDAIHWRVEEDVFTGRSYHCRHKIKDKEGKSTACRCNSTIPHSRNTNINSEWNRSARKLTNTVDHKNTFIQECLRTCTFS